MLLLQQSYPSRTSMSGIDENIRNRRFEHDLDTPERSFTDGQNGPGEARSLASRRPQSPFMASTGSRGSSQANIPPLRVNGEKARSHTQTKYDSVSPTPAMTAALDAMSIDSPTTALTRGFFDGGGNVSLSLSRSHSVSLPSTARRRLSLQTSFRPASVGRAPSRSPLMRSPLSRSLAADRSDESGRDRHPKSAYPVMYKPSATIAPLIPNPLHPMRLGQLPAIYTRDRLKQMGRRFLFDTKSADAFVRAAPLPSSSSSPRASPSLIHGNNAVTESVRIRIFPCLPVRKPFCISKKFPVRAHHLSVPPTAVDAGGAGSRPYRIEKRPHHHHHHHHSNPRGAQGGSTTTLEVPKDAKSRRRSESDITAVLRGRNVLDVPPTSAECEQSTDLRVAWPEFPIHIEYALYRVPLLAAILNSGYVHNGDAVEVPIPFPEAWENTVKWIYLFRVHEEEEETGEDGQRKQRQHHDIDFEKVRYNVEYLGGMMD